MRVLGSAVLVMESILMGFALLLAKDNQEAPVLWIGGSIAILMILCAGVLKRKFGWVLGSILQVAMVAYGIFVPSLFIMGVVFLGLWVAAIVVGRKGEEIRRKNQAAAAVSTEHDSAQ